MPDPLFDPEPPSTFAKDFKVFGEPGFLVSLLLGLLLFGAVGGTILYANILYGISPF